jgi:hypothetical protein
LIDFDGESMQNRTCFITSPASMIHSLPDHLRCFCTIVWFPYNACVISLFIPGVGSDACTRRWQFYEDPPQQTSAGSLAADSPLVRWNGSLFSQLQPTPNATDPKLSVRMFTSTKMANLFRVKKSITTIRER